MGIRFLRKGQVADKARSDVETGRAYGRIIFVTNRFARAKDRARVEDELSEKHGIPVTILDRTWIVRLEPTDYHRERQLEEIEQAIDDPGAFRVWSVSLSQRLLWPLSYRVVSSGRASKQRAGSLGPSDWPRRTAPIGRSLKPSTSKFGQPSGGLMILVS
jgi:hypothetical protein